MSSKVTVCRSLSILLRHTLGLAGLLAICHTTRANDTDAVLLTPRAADRTAQRVEVLVEVDGELRTNADGQEPQKSPVKVLGKLAYDEFLEAPAAAPPQSVRQYVLATADIQLRRGTVKPALRPERQVIRVRSEPAGTAILFSPGGPLTREELELIDVPGNSLLLARLLPDQPVKPGESWTHAPPLLAALLGLDAVADANVTSTLQRLDGDVAVIHLTGKLTGAVQGVATDLEVAAKYNFDHRQGLVTWFALSVREDRGIGHAQPGLRVTARIRVAVKPLEPTEELIALAAETAESSTAAGSDLLELSSSHGGFTVLHDRRWRTLVDRSDVTILRLIDRGDLLAQANVSKLPDEPQKELTLTMFQGSVEQALGDNLRQIVSTNETTDGGLRVLRVEAAGITSDLPVCWIYYHLSDGTGHHAAVVFTLEADLQERFAAADQSLISGFRFTPPAVAPKSTPAAQAARTPTGEQQSR